MKNLGRLEIHSVCFYRKIRNIRNKSKLFCDYSKRDGDKRFKLPDNKLHHCFSKLFRRGNFICDKTFCGTGSLKGFNCQ